MAWPSSTVCSELGATATVGAVQSTRTVTVPLLVVVVPPVSSAAARIDVLAVPPRAHVATLTAWEPFSPRAPAHGCRYV